ncbi:MAG: CRTAC1 family protein, partial [Candidatus Latescibacteria bacterium]|nr:CRTAC1 family protein [Candidatus Latescibacterota bacterium]
MGSIAAEGPLEDGEPGPAAVVTFTDVTRQAGIDFRHDNGASGRRYMPESMGSGCGFLDYDDDGDPDILLLSNTGLTERGARQSTTMSLYRNAG